MGLGGPPDKFCVYEAGNGAVTDRHGAATAVMGARVLAGSWGRESSTRIMT